MNNKNIRNYQHLAQAVCSRALFDAENLNNREEIERFMRSPEFDLWAEMSGYGTASFKDLLKKAISGKISPKEIRHKLLAG